MSLYTASRPTSLITLLAISLLLTACGGGESSSASNQSNPTNSTSATSVTSSAGTTTSSNATTNTGTASSSSNVASPPTNSVAETQVIASINQKRTQCGLFALKVNEELNKAASNHANYLNYVSVQNKFDYASHTEEITTSDTGKVIAYTDPATNPYFSGTTIADRVLTQNNLDNKLSQPKSGQNALAVNYSYRVVNENIAVDLVNLKAQPSAEAASQQGINGLLAAPYHLRGLMSNRVTEIAVKTIQANWSLDSGYHAYLNTLEIMTGLPISGSLATNHTLINYPCDGITDTEYALTNETPNPVPGRDLNTSPLGQPIYIMAATDKTISKVTAHITNQDVELSMPIILTSVNDPNTELANNEALIIPGTALMPASIYKVSYRLEYSDGTTEEKNFSFTTKA